METPEILKSDSGQIEQFEIKQTIEEIKNSDEDEEGEESRGFNIKKSAQHKSIAQIEEDIDREHEIEVDSVVQWDRLVRTLDEIRLSETLIDTHSNQNDNENMYTVADAVKVTPDPRQLLLSRNKGQRLTVMEKRYIYEEITRFGVEERAIKSKYSLSESTLNRIKAMFESGNPSAQLARDKLGIKIFQSRLVKRIAWDFILKQETPFCAKDVWDYIERRLKTRIDAKLMTKFMKFELNLSFKKATSRPLNLNVKSQHLLQILFSIRLVKQLEKWECIINIDEASISRLTKMNYSWLLRGASGSTKNIKFAGSWNIISAISTTGVSYSAVVNGTTNQSIFICDKEKLMKLVNKIESIPYSKVLLMMDNAPWHQARNVLKFLEERRIRYIFIPQYSPELAPVEKFFAQMKQKVIKAEHDSFNLTKEGVIIMRATLKSISQANVRLLWRNFYSRIRNLICDSGS